MEDYLEILSNFQAIGEQNPYIKQVKNLLSNTKPNPEKYFIAEGVWAMRKLIENDTEVRSFIVCKDHIHSDEAKELIKEISKKTDFKFTVSEKTFAKISDRDKPDGLLCVAQLPEYDIKDFKPNKNAVILVLDGIEIPGNVGTMIRMSDGAGVDAVFICNRKARLSHPKLIKGSMGAALSVPIFEFDNVESCAQWLLDHNFTIYLTDTRATKHYYEEPFGKSSAIVMGSERYGITRIWYEYPTTLISIPMLGKVDSLNVGVAATVIVYEATMKNKLNYKRN